MLGRMEGEYGSTPKRPTGAEKKRSEHTHRNRPCANQATTATQSPVFLREGTEWC